MSAPVLVWREVPRSDGQEWCANFGRFRAVVCWSWRGWTWEIGLASKPSAAGDSYGLASIIARENRIRPDTETRERSCAAAESAALSLILGALVAFPVEAPNVHVTPSRTCLVVVVTDELNPASALTIRKADAIAIGRALIAAGMAAGKEPGRG